MSAHDALHVVEIVHWIALGIMALVYILRLRWLLSFKNAKDRQLPGDMGTRSAGPALYSMANVLMPWGMESTRKNFPFYVTFVLFHLGVVAGIALAFVSSLNRGFMELPVVSTIFMVVLGAAFLISVGRVFRRFGRPMLRLISSPDDYFSLLMLTVWFLLGFFAQAHIAGYAAFASDWYMVAFLAATSFFLIYVPFSKISHYLYYPFTRFWIGKTLGHRGSFPARG